MNRRWAIAGGLGVIAALAVVLTLALRSSPGVEPHNASTHVAHLTVSIPSGFNNYPLENPYAGSGVTGHVLTNFPVPADATIDDVLSRWTAATAAFMWKRGASGPPSNDVALELSRRDEQACRFTCPPVRLHLPLSPNQPWSEERLASGAAGYRYGYVRLHRDVYYVLYWIGQEAPANDRSAVLQALRSIRPAAAT